MTAPPLEPCGKCGQRHVDGQGRPSCTKHRSSAGHRGEPCKGAPMRGQDVCKMHGGNSPQAKAKAERRLERERLEDLAVTLGDPVEGMDPGELIEEQIAARAGHVRWLRARVQHVEPKALTWGRTRKKLGGHDYGVTSEAKVHVLVVLYFDACTALERLCIDAIRAGLEERRVRLAERHGEVLEQLLDGILRDLGHDPDAPHTANVVARHLRLVGE